MFNCTAIYSRLIYKYCLFFYFSDSYELLWHTIDLPVFLSDISVNPLSLFLLFHLLRYHCLLIMFCKSRRFPVLKGSLFVYVRYNCEVMHVCISGQLGLLRFPESLSFADVADEQDYSGLVVSRFVCHPVVTIGITLWMVRRRETRRSTGVLPGVTHVPAAFKN